VPAAMRGKKLEGYVHAADWCKQAPSNPPCAPACQANEPENRVMQM
jgi:hypothetical protein